MKLYRRKTGTTFTSFYDGWDYGAYELTDAPGEYLVFLGRMSANKHPLGAIHIAQAAGMPIVLAGAPETAPEQVYFDTAIEPHIDGTEVSYIGV